MSNLEEFDPIAYLEDREIDFSTDGENVTAGWANIKCPFCPDHKNHLGISPTGFFNCYICGESGPVTKLIQEIDQCSWGEAEATLGLFRRDLLIKSYLDTEKGDKTVPGPDLTPLWPKLMLLDIPKIHKDYLQSRNFDPEKIVREYELRAVGNIGDWKFRLIIPVRSDREIVTFTSRDVTGRAISPYKHCSNQESVIPIKNTLYNMDSVHNTIVIVEGVTDVWRWGKGVVGTYGTQVTQEQVNLLIGRGIERAFVMLDEDAEKVAEKLAIQLQIFIPSVEVIDIPCGDPADMTDADVLHWRRELGI